MAKRIHVHEKQIEWFIDTVLIHDIGKMIKTPCLHYLSFGVMAVGIEVIGACLDNKEFGEEGESRARFNRGIQSFLCKSDPRYAKHIEKKSRYCLYDQLRCGMSHILRTGGKVSFTSRLGVKEMKLQHLTIAPQTKKLILVAEDFYDHFVEGCKDLRSQLPTLRKKHPKLNKPYMPITVYPD